MKIAQSTDILPIRRNAGIRSEIAFLRKILREMRDLYDQSENPTFKLRFLDQYSLACSRLAVMVRMQGSLQKEGNLNDEIDRQLVEVVAEMRRDEEAGRGEL